MVWEQLTDRNLKEYVRKDMYADAYSVLTANTAETPVSLALGTNTILGRLSGNIVALTASEVAGIVSPYINLDDGYDGFGANPATISVNNAEGQGDLTFALSNLSSVVFDLSALSGSGDGVMFNNGADYWDFRRVGTDKIYCYAELGNFDINVSDISGSIQLTANKGSNFEVSGGTLTLAGSLGVSIESSGNYLKFKDHHLSAAIEISQTGVTGLSGFTATSIVAALNELKAGGITGYSLDAGYNGFGANPATIVIDNAETQGDLTFAPSGDLSVVFDLSGCINASDGLLVSNGTQYFSLIRADTNKLSASVNIETFSIDAADNSFIAVDSADLSIGTQTSGDLYLTSAGEIYLQDTYLSAGIPVSETGVTGLVGFTAVSFVGSLNELKAGGITGYTLDDGYNASSGASTIVVDAGTLTWDVDGNYHYDVDITGCGDGYGFNVFDADDYFRLRRYVPASIIWTAELYSGDLNFSSTFELDATTISIDGTVASNLSITGANLTLSTITSGTLFVTSAALLDIDAGANIDIDVTGSFDMLSTGAFSIDGTGASNVSATSGNLTLSTITSGDLLLQASAAGNYGIGTSSFATSELGFIAMASGTKPTGSWPGDVAHLGVFDRGGTAGKAAWHFYCEDGTPSVIGDRFGFGTITPSTFGHFYSSDDTGVGVALRIQNYATTGQPSAQLSLVCGTTNKGEVSGVNFTNASYGIAPGLMFSAGSASDNILMRVGNCLTGGGNGAPVIITPSVYLGLGTATPEARIEQAQFSADAVGSYHLFTKSRHATQDTHTIVQDNDVIGGLKFCPSDGTDFGTVSAQIHAEVDDASPGASSIGGALVFSTAIGSGADDLTERLRIGADGVLYGSSLSFKDQYLSAGIPVSQTGTTGLVGFTATSFVAALNELKAAGGSVSLDGAYNTAAATITVDAYDVLWNLTGAFSHVIDASAATGTADGFQVNDGTDYWRLIHKGANTLDLDAALATGSIVCSANLTLDAQYWGITHNGTNLKTDIDLGGRVTNHSTPVELADDGSFDLPNASAGFGFLIVGDGEEYAQFTWTSAGVVTLISNSGTVVATDTDTKFCIFDNGSAVRIRNRLGSAKKVVFDYSYTTP